MAKKSPTLNAVAALERYIWSLKGKCESISDVNKQLISQYCRFVVLCEEISVDLVTNDHTQEELENKINNYEKFNKIVLNLYKTLKLDKIKDDLAAFDNPFLKLLQEEDSDGDI